MAYVVHNVQIGDPIYATTTNEQDAQIAANEQAIEAIEQRVDALETDVGDISQIETNVDTLQTSVSNLQTSVGNMQTSVGNMQTNVGNLQTNVSNLQTNVGNLQTAVSGKMNEPASEGTAGQVLTTDGNGQRTWTTIESGGSSIEIDDTLTQQGEAADAKATGDALATKLAKPATDGTNGQVLVANGQGGVSWQNGFAPMTTNDIDDIVEN